MSKGLVIFDSGHAKDTAGKVAPDKSLYEWDFNNDMQYKLKKRCEDHELKVCLTNPSPDKVKDIPLSTNTQNNINNAAAKYKIKAMVMKGDQPVFHDRFIIIDDEVWLSGNSLADIGNRASILIKLYSPSEVTDLYFKILNDKEKVVTLEEWIKNHEAAKN